MPDYRWGDRETGWRKEYVKTYGGDPKTLQRIDDAFPNSQILERNRAIMAYAVLVLARGEPMSVRGIAYALFRGTDISPVKVIKNMNKDEKPTHLRTVEQFMVKARLKGIIDWDDILDESRPVDLGNSTGYSSVRDFYQTMFSPIQYDRDFWADQPRRIEIWSEKATVKAWLRTILAEFRLPFMTTHGDTSWPSLKRVADEAPVTILYVGDHDPQGMKMVGTERNGITPGSLVDRLKEGEFEDVMVKRVALTRDYCIANDVTAWNYRQDSSTKLADWYDKSYPGGLAWELDAIIPSELRRLVRNAVIEHLDMDAWRASQRAEAKDRKQIRKDQVKLLGKGR